MSQFGARLAAREGRVAIWGMGYIGTSTAIAFADTGVHVTGYDPDSERVNRLEVELGNRVEVTSDVWRVLAAEYCVHLVAVPTEKDGEPFIGALVAVMSDLAQAISQGAFECPPLIIVESTVTPGTIDRTVRPLFEANGVVVGRDVLLGVAPRRDWFVGEGFGLRELDRVFAGVDDASAVAIFEVLSLINDRLHRASSHREGELVKTIENAFRHMDITLANELTLAFPDVDMVEILRLVGTKWNVGTYHPSFGTGGYCIPLSGRYLLAGTSRPEQLGLIQRAIEVDDGMPLRVVDAISGRDPVVILGVAYKGGLKVDIRSPTRAIVEELVRRGMHVVVHDPLYTSEEIDRLFGVGYTTNDIGRSLQSARTVLIGPDHPQFATAEYVDLLTAPRDQPLDVIDNLGVLAHVTWGPNIRYTRAGSANWLSRVGGDAHERES